jgi:hypothetical protein
LNQLFNDHVSPWNGEDQFREELKGALPATWTLAPSAPGQILAESALFSLGSRSTLSMHKSTEQDMDEKLDRLSDLSYQQFESSYGDLCRPIDAKDVPDQLESELEVSEKMITLSKEVATYYTPLIEKLVRAGVLTVNILQPTKGCGVFEVTSVLPLSKSYFNEGKILLVAEEEQVNGEGGKLIPEFRKRLGKFLAPWSGNSNP